MTDLSPEPQPSARAPRRRGLIAIVVAAIAVALLAWYFFGRAEKTDTDGKGATRPAAEGKSGKGAGKGGGRFGGGDPNRAQPVAAAVARTADVPVVQTGLGTATALRTVTVKPRVDGQLQSVAFTEGQLVKPGDLLAQIDPVPLQVALSQVEGTLARDAAQLNNARLDLERYQKLLTQDSIAQQQVDQQAALVRQLEGTVKVSQAQVDNARLQLSYTRITAPIAGRTGLRQVDAGNMVNGSDANGIAVITQVDPISVVFTIPQDTLPRVLARLSAGEKPPVEAWDREQKAVLARGVLATTDNQIDVATGTVRLKAQFPNPEGKLFPNQFVNVRMVVDVRRNVVVVPSAAIQRGAQGTVVYVVKEDNTVTLRPIVAGVAEGTVTEIVSGLQAGERVITDGVDRIREGAKVEVTEPGGGGTPGGAAPPGTKGDGKRGEGKRGDGKAIDPAKREEYRKRREAQGKARE
ncbi:MAG TPA: MdtA/MuxA family multidrug efflux RND transporter periplasmic adaptor subunit [Usitatibacter sp.]|nr:MdtA/MuxA family multidrug efflux RND transporter periplasmic adaptor subunit [Usitatibacter sp.]